MPWIAKLTPKEGVPLNVEPLEVEVVSEDDVHAIIRMATGEERRIRREFVWMTELEARVGLLRGRFDYIRQMTAEALLNDELPADPLRPAFRPRATSNPLRLGERNRLFFAQGNTFGKEVTVQKVLQLLAVTREALLSLSGVLKLISFANDFTKKLIAKYLIVEIATINQLCRRLSLLDENYRSDEFRELEDKIQVLDAQFAFKTVRNKLGAHLDADLDISEYVRNWALITSDSVFAYLSLFEEHLTRMMLSRYPDEYRMLILIPEKDMNLTPTDATNSAREYVPFDGLDL